MRHTNRTSDDHDPAADVEHLARTDHPAEDAPAPAEEPHWATAFPPMKRRIGIFRAKSFT